MQKTLTEQNLEEHDKAKNLLEKFKEKEKELGRKLKTIKYKRDGATIVVRTTDKKYNKEAMKKLGWEVTK